VEKNVTLQKAQEILWEACSPVGSEFVSLSDAYGRVLSENIYSPENVPPFDRSPLDGYAFMAADTSAASCENPAVFEIIEEVPAGYAPTKAVTSGKATKILTGAPIPKGADAVIKYEDTKRDGDFVSIFSSFKPGENIVPAGEDVKRGTLVASSGDIIDAPTVGLMAALGICDIPVYKKPKIGIISTGDELVDADAQLAPGKIRNSNRHTLEAACLKAGALPVYLGTSMDKDDRIAALINKGLKECDMIISTGGVSVGDYDMVHAAIRLTGAEFLLSRIDIKPGSACAAGVKDGKLILGLSGNPASTMTVFGLAGASCIRKLAGFSRYKPREIKVTLKDDFKKKSPRGRLLRGILELDSGTVVMNITGEQGNGVLSSMIGCNVIAQVPPNPQGLKAGTVLDAFLLD
jgi:molybdopterin molybdotransferase